MSKYQRVRERIAKQIEDHYPAFNLIDTIALADQILSDPDLLIKAEDQDMTIGVATKQLKNEGWTKTEEKPKFK